MYQSSFFLFHSKALSLGLLCLFLFSGCAQKKMHPITEKNLTGFMLPDLPREDKALVYGMFSNTFGTFPEVIFEYSKISKAQYEEGIKSPGLFTLIIEGVPQTPLPDPKPMGTLKQKEYRSLYLDPGYYAFRCSTNFISTDGTSLSPKTTVIHLEANKIYYLEGTYFQSGLVRHAPAHFVFKFIKDDLEGRFSLKQNFKKAPDPK